MMRDLTGFVGVPMRDVVEVLREAAAPEAGRDRIEPATAVVVDRVLELLRECSRQEILDDGLGLDRFLYSEEGQALRQRAPEVFGVWSGLSELLSEAARRSDRSAVDSILRHNRHGRAVLELLGERGEPVARSEIRRRLEISESHLSHVLRELDEADLIVRRREGSKGIIVELGPLGRELVDRSVLPAWVDRIVELMKQAQGGDLSVADSESLVRDLLEKGAPSVLAAQRLVEALLAEDAGLSSRARANARKLNDELETTDPHYANRRPVKGHPVEAFGLPQAA